MKQEKPRQDHTRPKEDQINQRRLQGKKLKQNPRKTTQDHTQNYNKLYDNPPKTSKSPDKITQDHKRPMKTTDDLKTPQIQ